MAHEIRPTILHIDDDEANRYAVRRILEKSGFDVVDSANGESGLLDAARFLPDLIVLDIKLPDIDGFEVCRRIKANRELHFIPVLQTSASFVSSDDKVVGLDSGADGYLAQPIEAAVLVATVRSLLRIRQAEKIAMEAKRSREEILAIVSHDLRNPLSFIMLQTKIMENQFKDGRLTQEELVLKMKKINSSCLKMNRLIQDMLDVTSIDQGAFHLEVRPFQLEALFKDVKSSFEDIALQSEISLILENNAGDITISGDKDRLIQLLGNLISNSLKFTLSGGEIRFTAEKSGNKLNLMVTDTGSGISKDDLPHVLNRFWQKHPERKNGYGIGLSIVNGIVEAHHGQLSIQSEEGRGTQISISLPLH